MPRIMLIILSVIFSLFLASCGQEKGAADQGFEVEVVYYKLENGLKVVLAPEHSVPTITVAVYYNIGFRLEPKGRTGFAHLFEHMMFEGTPNMPKGAFDKLIEGGGGVNNGSTRFDFTNYFEIMPSNQLEPILWVEADRMTALNITEENLTNQKAVVSNEIRVNVLNAPYGGFPWLDMPQAANTNWANAHNFYGDLNVLKATTVEEAQAFFNSYYAPNNAALVVAGDFDVDQARAWIEEYFGVIPPVDLPAPPDISEPVQEKEKFASKTDNFAPKPALAFAYHMPERNSPEYYAMGLLDMILLQGEDSRLYQKLVKEDGYTADISGGINLIGNMFNYNGPMLFTTSMIHDAGHSPEVIMASVDEVMTDIQQNGVTQEEIDRAMIKFRSRLYDTAGSASRFGLVDLLAPFALFDDDPARINDLEAQFHAVTPELIQKTAQEYLRNTNRTVLTIVPVDAQPAPADPAQGDQ